MMKLCSICKSSVDSESAPILVMGGYGNPKYLCDGCCADIEEATLGRDTEKIKAAMARVGEKMASCDVDDMLVITTVNETFAAAAERAEKIEKGEYDFSLDEGDEEEPEVPEELLESEEDKRLDEEEARAFKKADKYINIGMAIGAAVAVILFVLFRFVL